MLLNVYFVPVSCRRAARIMWGWVGLDWPRGKAIVFRTPAAKGISGEVRKAEPFGAGWDAACGLPSPIHSHLNRCFSVKLPFYYQHLTALFFFFFFYWAACQPLKCTLNINAPRRTAHLFIYFFLIGGGLRYKPLFCRFPLHSACKLTK